MKHATLRLTFAIAALLPLMAGAADAHRQAEVAERGKDVMPFQLQATVHIFTKTADGGTQRVVARNIADAGQTQLVRQHLREIQAQFLKGDFSGPAHIHGQEMPGLAQLRAAKPGQIAIDYREVEGGAELVFGSADGRLVSALHQWFDAQVSDHGRDAMAGHGH
ncbi:MAG: aspartate carbamoyltransferase [Burkholderiaceae bacterium]